METRKRAFQTMGFTRFQALSLYSQYTFSSFLAYLYSINTIFITYKHAISFFSIRGE